MKCKICHKFETNSFRGMSLHVVNKHHMNKKDYYDIFIKKDGEGVCLECGKETNFISFSKGYHIFCSSVCSNRSQETKDKIKQTKIRRYGNENFVNVKKSKETWKNKTQEEKDNIVNLRKKTNEIIYGNENFTNREKFKETCLRKYGVDCFTNREKFKETCMIRYGVTNIFELSEVQKKIKKYFLDNFGVDHPMKVESIKNITFQKVKEFYKNKNLEMFKKYFDILDYKNENHIYVQCKNCKEKFWIQKQYFIWRVNKKVHPCFKCFNLSNISLLEKEFIQFIESNYDGNTIKNSRKIINPYELDVYLPDLKLAFEFNGLYWHSEKNVSKDYHLNKTKMCEKLGIHLIHIYEDDWVYKQEIVKSRILNLMGKSKKIYARDCEIKEVSFKDSKKFLEENHIQGYCASKFNYGLYYNNILVALMTFSKLRKSLGLTNIQDFWELLRFCNKLNTNVVGGASKTFKYFLKKCNPKKVISYADRSWTMNNKNNLYDKLNFKLESVTKPNYFYIHNKLKRNRFNYRKDILVSQGFDANKSEREIMFDRKIYRIYNSGNLKYIWRNL